MISLLLPFFIGYAFVELFTTIKDVFEKLSIAFGIGIGYFSVALTINLIFEPLNLKLLNTISATILVLMLIFILRKERKLKKRFKKNLKKRYTPIYIKYLLFIFFGVLAFITIIWPVNSWDSLTIYDFRAHFFLNGQNLKDLSYLNTYDANRQSYYFSYPLLSSSVNVLSYVSGLKNPRILYYIFTLSFSYIFYKSLIRLGVNKKVVLLTLLVTLTYPPLYNVLRVSYSNSIYLYFLVGSIMFLVSWIENSDKGLILLSSLFLSFSIQTRYLEPLFLSVILPLFIYVFLKERKYLKTFFLYLIMPLISFSLWPYIQNYLHISFPNKQDSYVQIIALSLKNFSFLRLFEVIKFFGFSLFSVFDFLIIMFIVTFILHIFFIKKKQLKLSSLYYPSFILTIFLIMLVGTYLLSFSFVRWNQIPTSLVRSILPVVPLVFGYSAIIIYSDRWNL